MDLNYLYETLIISPTTDNKYIVREEYQYKDVTVPKGYKTNGANIPRIFWSIIPPFKPKFIPAIVIHDYLCDEEEYELADKYLRELLYAFKDSFITHSMVHIVKLYHKIRYGV